MPPLHAGDFFLRNEKSGMKKSEFGNSGTGGNRGGIQAVPAALPLLFLTDNEAAFFIRINGQG